MKDWDDEDDDVGRWGAVEALAIGALVLCIYVALLHDLVLRVLAVTAAN